MLNKKQERLRLLERQIDRVRRRINRLEPVSSRFSWARVLIFFGGLTLSVMMLFVVGWWLALVLAIITLLAYGIVAHFHGKIEASMTRHSIWMHIKLTHVARIKLDWQAIPPVSVTEPQEGHPFEIDLDISGPRSVHRLLNTAVSREGSERLREWLLRTSPDLSTISKRHALIRELTPMTLFRDTLQLRSQLAIGRVKEQLEGNRLLTWLNQQSRRASLGLLLGISAVLNALTLLLFIASLFVTMPQIWIVTLLASVLLFFSTGNKRGDIFGDATHLRYGFAALSQIFAFLEHYPYGNHVHLKAHCEPFFSNRAYNPSRLLRGTARIASASTLRNNGLLWLLVNALVPWDLYCAYRLSQYKTAIAARLPAWLDAWFELEALCSLATFAYLNPEYILPEISEQVQKERIVFQARALGHPLLPEEKKVTNDFGMDERGEVVIITGSNMSGKSTFLRTLGVNLCLAYAGSVVNASQFQTSQFRLFTCIRISDSVTDGYSYFYAEVKRLKALLDALSLPDSLPLFFLIDEIFKGTNNRERLIGSRSYVRALAGRNCVGIISTHDLELVRLSDTLPQVRNYHFREEVIDSHMIFDYVLRSGPSPTTNALKIMEMEGLPVENES